MGRCSLSSVLSLVEYCDCLVIGYAGTIRPQDDTEMYNQYFLFGNTSDGWITARENDDNPIRNGSSTSTNRAICRMVEMGDLSFY
mmetsp:Transcript_16063/g.26074  ORF Transcript_16063/g.26074 Transcript_16063/m.26074 type:complete len:85 (-) Transcript_16063:172-426(-)